MNIENTLKWIRETSPSDLPYNVKGVGWGPKTVNGVETDQYCVVFTVTKKQPSHLLLNQQVIPKQLNIHGVDIITDVIESTLIQKLVTPSCHVGYNTTNPPEPIASNRKKYRPLKGGVSSIHFGGTDATLGMLVRDKTDDQIVALSNNHVYAGSQLVADFRMANQGNVTNLYSLSSSQPGGYQYNPYASTNQTMDYIGTCKRAALVGDVNNQPDTSGALVTSCDAAILSLRDYTLINNSSANVLNFSKPAPYVFATDSEIDSLLNPTSVNYRSPVFRSGRTLGPVGKPGYSASCTLSVYNFNTAYVGPYSTKNSYFYNCFSVRGNVAGGAGGDSGSILFALLSSTVPSASAWKVIGLLFSGPADSSYTTGSRITTVADRLNIEPWDFNTTPIPTTLFSHPTYVRLPQTTNTVDLSGRTFFQVGF